MIDAFLRYTLQNYHIVVFGVAFSDPVCKRHTIAAHLSITEVPGSQVVFKGYIGSSGFSIACRDACTMELPQIKIPAPRETKKRSLQEAIEFCQPQQEKK